ncbi:hypothetical protein NM688_g3795 [Phlebia brevispora]|uniref:Uncharacterized protein n=1 Tax=Phlebia brevispora TaxID=194682 RepID=A0ACC1T4I3_9APHY|nr:hypothetical protein NM688_g3795 [Phlebia brevispora]
MCRLSLHLLKVPASQWHRFSPGSRQDGLRASWKTSFLSGTSVRASGAFLANGYEGSDRSRPSLAWCTYRHLRNGNIPANTGKLRRREHHFPRGFARANQNKQAYVGFCSRGSYDPPLSGEVYNGNVGRSRLISLASMSESAPIGLDPSFEANRVRLSALFFPAPNITYKQFSQHWLNIHGKLFMSLDIVKKNLTKYEQFHVNPELSNQMAAGLGNNERTPFWGIVTFEAESYEKINEVFQHPDYLRVVFPDEENILDRSKSLILAGEYATFFRD